MAVVTVVEVRTVVVEVMTFVRLDVERGVDMALGGFRLEWQWGMEK